MSGNKTAFNFKQIVSTAFSSGIKSSIESGNNNLYFSGLKGGSKYFVTALISEIVEDRKIVYVSKDDKSASLHRENLSAITTSDIPLIISKNLRKSRSLFDKKRHDESIRVDGLIRALNSKIVCIDISTLFEVITPPDTFKNAFLTINKDDELDRDQFLNMLLKIGYQNTDFVERLSEMSIRGSIVDVFPPGTDFPLRVEFFGDSISSIRKFNPTNQKSIDKINTATIAPSSFILYKDSELRSALKKIQDKAFEIGLTSSERDSMIDSVKDGISFDEAEWLLPYFYNDSATILDYFIDPIIIIDGELDPEYHIESLEQGFNNISGLSGTLSKLLCDFDSYYISSKKFQKKAAKILKINIDHLTKTQDTIIIDSDRIEIKRGSVKSLVKKIEELQNENYELTIFSYSKGEKEKLSQILNDYNIQKINNLVSPFLEGFILPEIKIAVITENEITEKKQRKSHSNKKFSDIPSAFITSFSELKPGDYIVHKEFGIGKFNGLVRLNFNGNEGDFIECEYKDKDKIFVPVEKLKLIQRYIGDSRKPAVEKLGTDSWKKTLKKVKKAVETIAKDLLELYAKRKTEKGYSFSPPDQMFNEFELAFAFNETDDQSKAIDEVMKDMESSKPMDRLICGDVGFGKTEVALRAAFKASMDGKQVAFLAPTTLLANQHYQNSVERLKDYPVEIDMLSRFRTTKEEKQIHKKLEEGKLDIAIGTHKLLSSKISFKDLGLVIIDEEQKFGVKHKEHLRSMRSGVDVLALSATPIPRTLQLSLTDIRDISLINTAPEGRKPVEVYVQNYDPKVIREAILKELNREGKVFFIHNRIEKIFEIAESVKELVPEAKIAVTHGRMSEKILESTLKDFISGDTNLLVTTAIVESGLDIAKANTIIVNDAHTFGLADLYQLKGRVGRSDVEAYSYFLIPSLNSLTVDARKRLQMLSELTDLGSGFKLALSDLEIRGAGNLFGKEQSGHIGDVGLEFYLELLKSTINSIKNENTVFDYEPEIKTNENAFIPDDYIESSSQRLFYYKKISSIQKNYEIREIRAELEDRFGNMPLSLRHLLNISELKIVLKEALIEKIDINKEKAVITFLDFSPYAKMFKPSKKYKIPLSSENKYENLKKSISDIIKGRVNSS